MTGRTNDLHGSAATGCMMLSFDGRSLSSVADMKVGRIGHGTVFHQGYVYVIGGANKSGLPTNTVERFDCDTMQWSAVKAMPQKLGKAVALSNAANGLIYVFGGKCINFNFHRTVYAFDPSCNRWIQKASMPISFEGLAGYIHGDTIYVMGILPDTDDGDAPHTMVVLSYDINRDTWTEVEREIEEEDDDIGPVQAWGSTLRVLAGCEEWDFYCPDAVLRKVSNSFGDHPTTDTECHLLKCMSLPSMSWRPNPAV